MVTQIFNRLYLGNFEDMVEWGTKRGNQTVICVLENSVLENFERKMLSSRTIYLPVLEDDESFSGQRAPERNLKLIAEEIEQQLKIPKHKVLVACGAGIERSPLAIMWYLFTKKSMTLNAAYEYVKRLRPIIMDRRSWIVWDSKRE